MTHNDSLYRPCVGIALFNARGEVLVAERGDNPGGWQMPQGGIDPGETPETAVFREMKEEIGTDKARIIGMMEDWQYYDLPDALAKKLWGGKYKGQRQKWIALEFTGTDADIRLDTHEHREFMQWKWVALTDVLNLAVPFKRDVYAKVVEAFAPFSRI